MARHYIQYTGSIFYRPFVVIQCRPTIVVDRLGEMLQLDKKLFTSTNLRVSMVFCADDTV